MPDSPDSEERQHVRPRPRQCRFVIGGGLETELLKSSRAGSRSCGCGGKQIQRGKLFFGELAEASLIRSVVQSKSNATGFIRANRWATMFNMPVAYEVKLNGGRLCVAGMRGNGVLTAIIAHGKKGSSEELQLTIGGLDSETGTQLTWIDTALAMGDDIEVRVVEAISIDEPTERRDRNPDEELESQKNYVRTMAKKLGWRLDEAPGGKSSS